MKLAEFKALITSFTKGQLDKTALSSGIDQLLTDKPDISPAELLENVQSLLADGNIDPKQFRDITGMITELNIQRILQSSGHTDTAADAADNAGDETFIMPNSATTTDHEGQEETLIVPPGVNAGSEHEKTLLVRGQKAYQESQHRQKKNKSKKKHPQAAKSTQLQPGDVIKGRFELLDIIGQGGMGVVFRAKDLVKVQAQDSNPYVAIKVLSEAFKKHSRAFIALQREASKAQRLAHPNIATVYDFDHDNDIIYMTMELLHGQPFDKLIAQLPPGGLPYETGLHYIRELCNGLSYAHQQNLIHCDLKPANIFLCDNGAVKLLDFGITRVIKKERKEVGDDTVFDPASLKALTPAYASVEMFRGDTPDPRDDIYALACVAYELLTGVHPYKKVAAHKALELDLKPPTIKGISRRQQKAFNSALSLVREKRTATVPAFLDGIKRTKNHAKHLAIAGFIIVLISGSLLIDPILKQRKEDAQLALIQTIKSGNQEKLIELLTGINELDEISRDYMASTLRKEIISHYQVRINSVINAKQKLYDFPEASRLLAEVKQLYPDSASLAEAEKQLTLKKERFINALLEQYQHFKSSGSDTSRILEILREADPNNSLLNQTPADKP